MTPPIEVSIGHSDLRSDTTAVHLTQALASRTVRGYVIVPNDLLADAAMPIEHILQRHMDRLFRPWRYPDANPFPVIDLFPRFTRAVRWIRRLTNQETTPT